jgi:hypothetical protein
MVGAYFVGFFSGRYVGFESARESSGSEVAKLPVPDGPQAGLVQNPSNVYDRLKAPAVMKSPDSSGASAEKALGAPQVKAGQLGAVPQIIGGQIGDSEPSKSIERTGSKSASSSASDEEETQAAQAGSVDSDLEGLVADVEGGGPELIIGSDDGLAGAKLPESVRMLGGAEGAKGVVREPLQPQVQPGDQVVGKEVKTAKSASSADALLEERIANARSDSAKSATAGAATQSKDSGPLVRKVVPSGYFAQVAAPKKLGEAEAIAGKLKRSGFPVVVESASVAGQSFYRVLVGPEQNKARADILVSQLKSESYLAGDPFIRKFK